jgi:hypothetical protein
MYPILETNNIILRPFNNDDTEIVFNLICAHKQQNEGTYKDVNNLEDAKRVNYETVKAGCYFLIVCKKTQTPIGWILCDKALGHKIQKRAYISNPWIRNEYKNIGYELEILEKIMNFAFFGIKTEFVVVNAKNSEQFFYQLYSDYGFEIYNYFPKSKPKDDAETTIQFSISKKKYENQEHIIIETYDYQPPLQIVSPYSFAKPIRKIDSIQYIKQPTEYLCGQAVIAMLANVSVDEVISVMQNDKGTGTPMMKNTLKHYGIKTATSTRVKFTEGMTLPDCCILSIKMPGYGHWSLYYKSVFYDPEFGVLHELPNNAKLVSYWEIII